LQCPNVLIDVSDRGTSEGYRENFEKFFWRYITIVVGVFRLEFGFKGVVEVWSGGDIVRDLLAYSSFKGYTGVWVV
jgi:hypothetical protein